MQKLGIGATKHGQTAPIFKQEKIERGLGLHEQQTPDAKCATPKGNGINAVVIAAKGLMLSVQVMLLIEAIAVLCRSLLAVLCGGWQRYLCGAILQHV